MKTKFSLIIFLFYALSLQSQNVVGVAKSGDGQTINLKNDQVLEIQLPCNPSTGYGWYPISLDKSVITQTGDWEFIPNKNKGMPGRPGTEIIRFIGVSKGTSQLTMEYRRPWEKNKSSVDNFKLTLISDGIYTGNYKLKIKSEKLKVQSESYKSVKSALPSSFSWQPQCTSVKNQGDCGSCWAFAATGSFEAIINITDGNMRSLSEQWLINCTSPHNDSINGFNGCHGGFSPNYMWVSPGAVYESVLPYADGSCDKNSDTSECIGACGTYIYHEKADSSGYINGKSPSVDQIKQAIYNYGPVWSGVDVGIDFEEYTGGVFTTNDDTTGLNHAVALVGWKDSTLSNGSSGYWILRNSWGPEWGEHGYMRIGYGVSSVGDSSNYIVYKGGIPSCQGAPTPGNTLTSANPICSYEAISLSQQNFTSGKGVSYQWQSSPDSITWSNISSVTNATAYVVLQTDTTYYRCEVICSSDTTNSKAIKEITIPPPVTPTAGEQTPTENQIIWNWNPVIGASGYKWNTINNYMSAIGNGKSTSYTQTGLTRNSQYTLYVWSYNICGNSDAVILKQNTTTRVDNLIKGEQLNIYPNPVSNELIIETNANALFNINLTNIIGQLIYNSILNKRAVIDMKNLRNGMYLLKISDEKDVVVRKIIKN